MDKCSCLLCRKEFWLNDIWIWKLDLEQPLYFCMDCSEKWEDNNEWEWGVFEWEKYCWFL